MNFDHNTYKQSFMESLSSQMNLNSSSDEGDSGNKSVDNSKKIDYVHKRMEEVLNGVKDTSPKDDTVNLESLSSQFDLQPEPCDNVDPRDEIAKKMKFMQSRIEEVLNGKGDYNSEDITIDSDDVKK